MSRLPVIVGLGGINPAGRVSCHHAYKRLVIDALGESDAAPTYASLASLMNLDDDPTARGTRDHIERHTLIRRIEGFDAANVPWQRSARLMPADGGTVRFTLSARHMPDVVPASWSVKERGDGDLDVTVAGGVDVLLPDARVSRVTSAGQLPTGFAPDALYQSRNHPRGLQLAVYGASDAIRSTGIDWDHIRERVRPDEVAVYSGSSMGQLDGNGTGGLLQAPMTGKRTTSKQVALGLCEMPADFVNAYVLGGAGGTGATIGACATFLYNLRLGIDEIKQGRRRVAVIGNSEAPIIPEIIEGYRTMGALAEDDALMALDGRTDGPDHRRACRPFAENCGFTLAESAVYCVLFDDTLALELGADIYGAVAGVFVNADGYKKSIPGPGIGNYLTMAKAMGLARTLLGETALRRCSYVQAHGTGTPQNRVTESHIMNELARVFGIERWTVAAVKAYLGHSLAPASGDQLSAVLGAWRYGVIPGITTIDGIADDVHADHLSFSPTHVEIEPDAMDTTLINSKGFGGNNATGVILAPHVVTRMLAARHGAAAMTAHRRRNEAVRAEAEDYDRAATAGEVQPIYRFGEGVLEGKDLTISDRGIRVPGYGLELLIDEDNPFPDMTDE